MNSKILSLCLTLLISNVLGAFAGEPAKPRAASPEFERLKTLVGTWTGKGDMGEGPVDMTVQYRLLAAGSVLEERCFLNTPNEMVTMFYEKEGKLALTHYCMLGNRPTMALKTADANSLTFDFDAACCTIDTKKESHMHGMTIRFDDADTITASCKALINGTEMAEHPVTMKRLKTQAQN